MKLCMLTSRMRLSASTTMFMEPLRYHMEKSNSWMKSTDRALQRLSLVGH